MVHKEKKIIKLLSWQHVTRQVLLNSIDSEKSKWVSQILLYLLLTKEFNYILLEIKLFILAQSIPWGS